MSYTYTPIYGGILYTIVYSIKIKNIIVVREIGYYNGSRML